ncbi:hypothetical protein V8C86DRAFT_3132724 [Haematococcus lacustris]
MFGYIKHAGANYTTCLTSMHLTEAGHLRASTAELARTSEGMASPLGVAATFMAACHHQPHSASVPSPARPFKPGSAPSPALPPSLEPQHEGPAARRPVVAAEAFPAPI